MFKRVIEFSDDSTLELESRIIENKEEIMLTLIGQKSPEELMASSIILSEEQLLNLKDYIQEALDREMVWPVTEQQ